MHPWHPRSRPLLRHVSILLGWACLAAIPLAAQEFAINQLITGDQRAPDVAALPDGGFIVVWQSPVTPGDDTDGLAILGRYLDSSGTLTSGDFQLNNYTTFSQRRPRVATRQDGSFVLSWVDSDSSSPESLDNLRARTFDSSGNGSPNNFQVDTAQNVDSHAVGAADSGQFVVASSRRDYDSNGYLSGSARLRRFQSNGTEIDSTALTGSGSQVVTVSMAGNDGDGFVVAAAQRSYYASESQVRATRLDTGGAVDGSSIDVYGDQPFDIATATGVDVALEPPGAFFVVWNGDDTSYLTTVEVHGRRVDATDVLDPAGPQQINTYTTGFESSPRIARGGDGTFLVVWEDMGAPGDDNTGIRGRWLDSLGVPMGEAFAVNEQTTSVQRNPQVAASADGSQFLVVWTSPVDGDGNGIRGRRFFLQSLYRDGFESGDVSLWSSSEP